MSNGHTTEVFKRQIGDAIVKAKSSGAPEGVIDISVLNIRLTEMILDDMSDFKRTIGMFVEQRQFVVKLWKLAAFLVSGSGLLGTVLLLMQLVQSLQKW